MSYTSETLLKDNMIDRLKMASSKNVKCKRHLNKNIDLSTLTAYIVSWFKDRKFKLHIIAKDNKILIQGEKKGWARTVTACNRNLNVLIEGKSGDFTVKMGSGKWVENTASVVIGAFITGGASICVTGATCAWTWKLKVELYKFIEDTIEFMN